VIIISKEEIMKVDKVFDLIKQKLPQTIFVTGKTSTGKSTFARKLRDELGYKIVELDQLVMNSVVNKEPKENPGYIFLQVYRGGERKDWIDAFVEETKEEMTKYSDEKIVIEGALAHNETLDKILNSKDFFFVYFHPVNKEKYIGMLTERFVAGAHDRTTGLPKHFWVKVDENVLQEYLKTSDLSEQLKSALSSYAQSSIEQSEERFNYFANHFSDIVKTSI